LNAVLRMAETSDLPARLVTASAGNHGRALAVAAASTGLALTVFVPERAPAVKLQALRRAGAQLVTCVDYDEAERQAKQEAVDAGARYVSPYADPDVIAGAGTVAVEILEDDPAIEAIVVPVGGGGLISGVAIAAAGRAETLGVEAEATSPFTRSLAAGRVVAIDVQPTLADGLAGNLDPGSVTFDLVRRHVASLATVSEREIVTAIAGLFSEERSIAEGAAAVAIAGVLTRRIDLRGRRAAVVLTGANIDPDVLWGII
jgi:threonine dehydratase